MSDLKRLFERRTTRGTTRGADAVWAAANSTTASAAPAPASRPWLVFAGAFAVVLVVGVAIGLISSTGTPINPFPPATTPTGQACLTPPANAMTREGIGFELTVAPSKVEAGQIASIRLSPIPGGPADQLTGLSAQWQCWDGEEWASIYSLGKAIDGAEPREPGVIPYDPNSGTFGIGFRLPLTGRILVPEVGPGVFRVFDTTNDSAGWTFVEVIGVSTSPPPETSTTTSPSSTTTTVPTPATTIPQGVDWDRPTICPTCQTEIVARVPIGPDGVSYENVGVSEALPWGPRALRVDAEGTFYILDGVNPGVVVIRGTEVTRVPLEWEGRRGLLGLAVIGDRLWILDIFTYHDGDTAVDRSRLVEVDLEGTVRQMIDLPPSITLENGLSGLSSGPDGELWVERYGGGRVARVHPDDPTAVTFHEGFPHPQRNFPGTTVGINPDLSYVEIRDEVGQNPDLSIKVTLTARWREFDNTVVAEYVLPNDEQFLYVDHPAVVGADGYLYYLLTQETEVLILRLPWH